MTVAIFIFYEFQNNKYILNKVAVYNIYIDTKISDTM